MIILADYIVEIDGKRYVPFEVAQSAVQEATDAFDKIEQAFVSINETIGKLSDND
jgi:methanogenic corrinoid protein MtbC1